MGQSEVYVCVLLCFREREDPLHFTLVNLHNDPRLSALHSHTNPLLSCTEQKHTHTLSDQHRDEGNTQSVSDTWELEEEIFPLYDLLMKPGKRWRGDVEREKKMEESNKKVVRGQPYERNKRQRAVIEALVEDEEECLCIIKQPQC